MRYSVFVSTFCNTSVHIFIFVNNSRPFVDDGEVSIIPFVFLSPSFHPPVFLCHPFYLSSSSSFVLFYLTNGGFDFFKRDTNWSFIIYRLRLLHYRGKISYLSHIYSLERNILMGHIWSISFTSNFHPSFQETENMCSEINPDFMIKFNFIWQYRSKNHPKRIAEVSDFYLDLLVI